MGRQIPVATEVRIITGTMAMVPVPAPAGDSMVGGATVAVVVMAVAAADQAHTYIYLTQILPAATAETPAAPAR